MKTSILTLFIFISVRVFSQWAEVDTVNAKYKSIYFYNDQIGFITSNTYYKKTIDGGNSWTTAAIPNPYGYSDRFYFLNPDTGFMGGLVTHNGGATWTSVSSFTSPFCFTQNNKYAYAVAFMPFGNQAPSFKSGNFGENWQTKGFIVPDPNSLNSGARDIYFADSIHGIIGALGGDIFSTTNGANSWTRKQPLGNNYNITAVYMVNQNIAYAAAHPEYIGPFDADQSKILRSTNGGDTWTTISTVYGEVKKMIFLDSIRGYLCNNSGFYSTHDQGANWVIDTTVSNVRDFSFINSGQVFLLTWDSVLTNGAVYKRDLIEGVGEVSLKKKGIIKLYPSPVINQAKLEIDQQYIGEEAAVTDVTGKILITRKLTSYINNLETTTLPSGVYFLRVRDEVLQFAKQ